MIIASCLCPTFNRLSLLEEAVESFLRQDYAHKELLILNDCAQQEIVCDSPGVTVINMPRRLSSIGEKRNFLASIAAGQVLFPWDDDDISLPHRISASIARLGATYDYHQPKHYWLLDANGLHSDHPMSVGHNCSAFSSALFHRVGGYPHRSLGEDAEMDRYLQYRGNAVADVWLPIEDWFYIYRWDVTQHTSSMGEDGYDRLGKVDVTPGRFVLNPHWDQPYDEMVEGFARA